MTETNGRENFERPPAVTRAWGLLIAACLALAGILPVTAAVPANDNYTNAQVITGISGSLSFPYGSTVGATNEPGEPNHAGFPASNSVWFSWTAPISGDATFDTFDNAVTDFDTVLAVYTNTTSLATLVEVASNDNIFFFPGPSYVSFPVRAGVEYRIAVDGRLGASGKFNLNWEVVNNGLPAVNEFQFFSTNLSVLENTPGFITVAVLYGGGAVGDVTVDYATSDITAAAGSDYTPRIGTLTFTNGETIQTFTVPIFDNPNGGSNLTFGLTLSNATGGAVLGAFSNAVVTIVDDETANFVGTSGEFNFSSPASFFGGGYIVTDQESFLSAADNYRSVPGALITVIRTNGSTGRVLIDYDTEDASATEFLDYTPQHGTLIFDDFQMSTNFIVPVFTSFFGFGSSNIFVKQVNLKLSNPRAAPGENPGLIRPTLGSVSNSVLGIAQVSAPLRVAFERLSYRVDEYGGRSITVAIVNGHPDPGTVNIRMNNYSGGALRAGSDYATPGVDFTDVSGPVAIGGNGRATFTIPILDDSLVEFNEDIILIIESSNLPIHPYARVANVTILADEDPPGALDREWNRDGVAGTTPPFNSTPGANNVVSVVAVQTDGKTVLGGDFTAVNTFPRHHIARLNVDGSLDQTFNPGNGADSFVSSLVLYPTNSVHAGKMLIGGGFASFNGTQRNSIARLNANGSLDLTFNPGNGALGPVRSIALQTNGQIIVAGEFAFFNDAVRHGVARLNDDGSLDETFNVGTGGDDVVRVVAVQTGAGGTNKILVAGDFVFFNGEYNNGIVRLNPDGSVDGTFSTGLGVDGPVHALAVQTNGSILVGGSFSDVDGRVRNNLARLGVDGVLDLSFQSGSGANDSVYTITLQPDGRPLIGGIFTSYNTTRRVGLARLKVDGSLDTTFMDTAYNHFAGLVNPLSFEPKNFVNSIAIQTNGNVMIGGSFTNLGGNACLEINNSASYTPVWTRQNQRTRFNIASLLGNWGTSLGTNSAPNPVQGPGNAEFTLGSYTTDENSPFSTVTLRRIDGNLGTLDVLAGTLDRLAIAGVDYFGATNAQSWPEFAGFMRSVGSTAPNYFFITNIDDAFIEGNETLDLSLTRVMGGLTLGGEFIPLGGALGTAESVMTIADNDFPAGVFSFSSPVYHTNENAVQATITVIRTNGFTGRVTVDYQTRNGTATAGADYLTTTNTLTFDSGITNRTFTVTIIDDTDVEFDETVLLVLTNATGGATLPGGLPTSTSTAVLTIIDNDFPSGRVNFSSTNYTASEADGFASIIVTRTGGNVGAVTVQYATSDGTATNGLDYLGSTNVLSWSDGDSSDRIITVPLSADGLVEGPETVNLRLFNPSIVGALGSRTNAVLTILNSDAYGNLAFSHAFYVTDENGTSVLITVVRTEGVAGTVSVDFATAPDTAIIGTDYFSTNGTLVFQPGELSKQFSIAIQDDTDADGDRTVFLALSNPTNASLGMVSSALLTIIDNESGNTLAGTLDTTFNATAQANQPVYALALQPDGHLLMAGDFTKVNSVTRNRVARLTSGGFLDGTFNSGTGPNDSVRAMVLQTDGKVLIGGSFTQIDNTNRSRIGRLNIDGTVDHFFNPGSGADGIVNALAMQTDGKVLVGGAFSKFNGITAPGVVRLNTNGTVDSVFNANAGSGANGIVHAVAVQADGKMVVGGEFSVFNGTNLNNLARLNVNGTLDATFAVGTGPDSTVRSILVQPDGSLVVGGSFTNFNGVARNFLLRLNPSGTLDTNFLAGEIGGNGSVLSLAQQTDGKLLVGGSFTRFNDVSRGRLTRLNANGATDPTINFGSGANSFISAMVIQPDRKIVLGGGFSTYDDKPRKSIARIHGGSVAGPGTLEFAVPVFQVAENLAEAVIVVKRRGGTTGAITVDFSTFDGTAVANTNYFATNGTLMFPQAETLAFFSVRLIDNLLVDSSRTVNLVLSNYTGGATSGPQPTATLVIDNDDALVGFSSAFYSVGEGSVSGKATITVTRSGNTNSFVSVNYSTTTNGTATDGLDYFGTNGVLSFLPGETVKNFNVFIIDDVLGEANETVGLVLQPIVGTNSVLPGITNAILTIVENDFSPGQFTFTVVSNSVSEAIGSATVLVLRTNGSGNAATVKYTLFDGTAKAGIDYVSSSNIISFAAGETLKSFLVPIINNTNVDGDRALLIQLSDATGGATLGTITNQTLYILDDELGPSYFNFASANFGVNEFEPFATITVTRTNSRRGVVSVAVNTANGTATAGQDYFTTTTNLTFQDNVTSLSFTVPIINDTLGEGDETVLLSLSLLDATNFLGLASATLTITNDDTTLRFSTNAYFVAENGTNAVITVVRTGVTNTAIAVNYFTAPVTAVAGLDYVPVTGTLNWAPNDPAAKTFLVPIVDNTSFNNNRTFLVLLTNVVGTATSYIESPSNAVVTIINDEAVGPVSGVVDPTFNENYGANGPVYAVAYDITERLYVGGDFTYYNGLAQNRLTRLTTDGTVDIAFNSGSGFDNTVYAITVNTNLGGVVAVGGAFSNYNGQAAGRIALLGPTGAAVPGFNPSSGANDTVYALALSPLPATPFFRSSFFNGPNDDNNSIPAGANSGTVSVTFTFDPVFNPGTNVLIVTNTFRIYYGGVAIFQTNLPTSNTFVGGSVSIPFGPGAASSISIVVNQGLTTGTDWDYFGTITTGSGTDQRLILAGAFTSVNGTPQGHISQLDPSGAINPGFLSGVGANQPIYALAATPLGQIYIGGSFTSYNLSNAYSVARLNPDGTLDPFFNVAGVLDDMSGQFVGADGAVRAIAVQTNGGVIIGGDFVTVSGVPRNHIARLLPDGTVDVNFNPGTGFDGNVRSISIQFDGRIVVAGEFTSFNGNVNYHLARLNADGTLDPDFEVGSGANDTVHSVALSPESFNSTQVIPRSASGDDQEDRLVVDTGANSGTITINYDFLFVPDNIRVYYNGVRLVDLTTNDIGTLVIPYGPGPSTTITVVMNEGGGVSGTAWDYTLTINTSVVVPERRIAIGGEFTVVDGIQRHRVAVLSGDGAPLLRFDPGASPTKTVYALGIYTNTAQPSLIGKVIAAGDFTALVGVDQQNRIGRLHFDGTLDTNFYAGAGPNKTVRALALQPDGKVVIGGAFDQVNLVNRAFLARLHTNGVLDTAFNPGIGLNGSVLALALQPDGKVIIGGTFNLVYGAPHSGIARVHANGTVDSSFTNGLGGVNGAVKAVAIDANGKVVIGGNFTTVHGQPRSHIARLNTNGTLDVTFNPPGGTDTSVETLVIQEDGKIVIGGTFGTVNGVPGMNGIARLNTNGTLDGLFNAGPGANNFVDSIALQADGKMVVGGGFTLFGGQNRNRLVRLNPDGSLDVSVNFGTGADNFVSAVALQPFDGKIVVGGGFTHFDSEVRVAIARLFAGTNTDAGRFEFSAPAYTVGEKGMNAILTVLRKGGTVTDADVTFSTTDDSALAPGDYTDTGIVLHFAAGESFQTVAVPIIDNTFTNINKSFTARLTGPTGGAALGGNSNAVVTIIDNDSLIQFSDLVYTVSEGGVSARITVARLGGSSETVTVDYATGTNGTATPLLDFTPVSGTLTFLPGVRQRTFDVPVLEDAIPELTETVMLVLSNATGPVTISSNSAVLNIVDNETSPGVLGFGTNSYTVSEDGNFVVIDVIRTNGFFGTLSVNFSTTNLTALAGVHYFTTNGTLTFLGGETQKTFTVRIINETNTEGPHTVSLQLSAVTGGATIGLGSAELTIYDDESAGSIEFEQAVYTVSESVGTALITLRRVGSTNGPVSVTYQTGGGTATPGLGLDYLSVTGQVVFAHGQTTTNFLVTILDDGLSEGTETIGLTLTTNAGSHGVLVGPQGTARIDIVDNDSSLAFSQAGYTFSESNAFATIVVVRRGSTNTPVSVDYFTAPGTAVAGLDYVPVTGTLSWSSTDPATKTFLVPIVDNTSFNPDRTFLVLLTNVVGAPFSYIDSPSNAVVTIVNDETENPVSGVVDPTFNENYGANKTVYAVAYDIAERLYVGGEFTYYNGLAQNRFTRLNTNGAVDVSFNSGTGFNDAVYAITVNTNAGGVVAVGGAFTNYNGQAAGRVALLGPNGTPVPTFLPPGGANDTVYAVALSPLPLTPFFRSSFFNGPNNDSNSIPAGANAGTVNVTFSFDPVFFFSTNVVTNNFRIYYDGVAIFQTNLVTSNSPVTGSASVAFGPGVATNIAIVVNAGLNNGTGWEYTGNITTGLGTDQRLILAGAFSTVNGTSQGHISQLNPNGTINPGFLSGVGANQTIHALATTPLGQIYIGGDFSSYNLSNAYSVARLNADGTIDPFFNLAVVQDDFSGQFIGADGSVRAIAVQADGGVIIGGDFLTVSGVPRNRIARLLPDGTVDVTFNPGIGFDGRVRSISVQDDGRIVVGGDFTSFNGNTNNRVARLNADGTLDTDFNVGSGANNQVYSVALSRDSFTSTQVFPRSASGDDQEDRFTVDTGANSGTITINYDFYFIDDNIRVYYNGVRLINLTTNDAGTLVIPYGPGPSTSITVVMNEGLGIPGTVWDYTLIINTVLTVPEKRIAIGGEFTSVNGLPRRRVAVLNADGSSFTRFDPALSQNKTVYALGVFTNTAQPSLIGKVMVGGDFKTLVGVDQQNRIARLNFDGTIDTSFYAGAGPNKTVRALALQPDGKVVIGGAFNTVNLVNRAFLARLNTNGVVDTDFNPGIGLNGSVLALARQSDGKFIIGGTFSLVYGSSRSAIARVHANGTVDTSFANGLLGANGSVKAVAIDADGRIVIGGDFTTVHGQPRNHIARLNTNGTLDVSFAPPGGTDTSVETLAIQEDGKIVIGGTFSTVNGVLNLNGIARLNTGGTLDGLFNAGPGANNSVGSIALQTDGKMVLGGAFTLFGGQHRNRLVRLNANGSLDASVNFGTGADNFVSAVALQPHDGKIVVGGGFTKFDGEVRVAIARLFAGTNTDAGRFEFSAPAYTVTENGVNATLTVLRKGGTVTDADVTFSTADDSALAPGDYTGTGIVLHFAAGESFQNVTVPIIDNALTNANKAFSARLTAPTGGAGLGANSNAVVTIIDNDSVIQFSELAYTVSEGGVSARITVSRLGGSIETVSVDYATGTNGTATPLLDFTPVSGTLIFAPGVRQRTFDVPVLEDAIPELTETVPLLLSNATGPATIISNSAVLNIVDNETDPGVLGFSTNSFTVSEDGNYVVIDVIRTNGFFGTVTVNFNTSNGTALAGIKYYATNGTLTFVSGETNKSFQVRIINETNLEGSQTVQLQLSGATGGSSIGLGSAQLVIRDDESAGSIEFDQPVYTVNENAGAALITLRRVGGSVGVVSVTYQTSGGTATPGFGSDYLSVTGQVVFAHGQTTTNFVVTILEDVLSEGTETIGLLLSTNANSNGAFIGAQGTARIDIVDNDSSFTFSAPNYSVTESGTFATITVLRFGNTNSAATVDFGTTPGSATPGLDYYSTNGTLQFAAGVTNQTFLVRIIDDTLPEGDEYLNLTLSNPSGGATLVPLQTAILTISDNDVTLSFSSATYSVGESNTLKTIAVLRSGATNTSATVQYSITDGTATAGLDYSATSGTLSFPPGVISNGFTVTIFDDLIAEGDETVALTLLNPTGALLGGQPTAVLSIIDNDSSVGFSTSSYVVNEKATNAVITLVRKGLASGQVTVVFKTTILGTATVNSDYLAVSNVVTWPDGDLTPKTVLVPIIDDSILEGSETVNLNLSNPTGGALLEIAAATLFIVDNAGSIAFASVNVTAIEGSNAVFTLVRTGGSNGVVTVQYVASGGNATPEVDYLNSTGVVAFAHGETTKNLTIPIVDDALVEGFETVNVALSNAGGGARVGDPSVATLTILDNEVGVIVANGSALIGETNSNGLIDPGETVTFLFSLRNVGSVDTVNLMATLLPGNGVAGPSGSQNYGAVLAGGNSVARPFTFTASGTNGSQLTATLLLTDGAITNGYVSFTYNVGAGAVTFANANPITINDNAPASPYPATIQVAGVVGAISKVTVKLNNLSHNFPDDLDIALVGPQGQVVMLMSDSGGGNSLNNVTLTFDDAAASGLPDSAAISTGTYRPSNNGVQSDPFTAPGPVSPFSTLLSGFNGTDANGTWSLFIMDDTSQDGGLIAAGWSLTITTGGGLPTFADLSVSASDSADPVLLNGNLIYTISVTNHGPGTAANVLFTNQLPAGVTFSSASSSQGSVSSSPGKVTGNLGPLAYGQFATVTISVTVPGFSTVLTNIASVIAAQTDLNTGNNVSSIKTTVTIVPSLSFSRKSGNFVVTWPAVANNFVLQVTPTFTPTDWVDATNAVQNINGTNTVSVPLSTGASRFYRLRMAP